MPNPKPSRPRTQPPLDLVATAAHELKSPLVLIRGLATMLAEQQFGPVTPDQAKYLTKINDASERLLKLITNLLTINQVSHRAITLNTSPVGINKIIKQVISELQPRLTERQMTVVWADQIQLPAVIGDEQMLYQVFYNLIDNTIKYSPAKTSLTIKFRVGLRHLAIQVKDQGIGLKKQELGRLFERFGALVQPVNSQAGSSGLGLFIVKTLVELQGGQVSANRLKRGSCFTVSLPTMRQLELFNHA